MSSYIFGNASPELLSFKLDYNLYTELSHLLDTNSVAKQCVGVLERFLFQGIEIRGAKKMMNTYLDVYFIPFFRQMLRQIVLLGWCPYHLKKIKDPVTGMMTVVPEVYPVEYIGCELLVNKEKLDYEFQFWSFDRTKIRKDIHVFMFTDMAQLASNGLIHSVLSGLLEENRYVSSIRKFTIQCESVRSNPPVYLKLDTSGAGQSGLANRTNGFQGGLQNGTRTVQVETGDAVPNPANFMAGRVQQTSDSLEKASTDVVKNVEFHQNQVHALAAMHDNNYYNLGLGFAPQWYNNLFICPPAMTLAAPPQLPEARVDQLTMMRKLASDIYLCFGIPETLLGIVGGTSTSIKGNVERSSIRKDVNIMDVNAFESTLFRYTNFFQNCFVVLFGEIFDKVVEKDIVEFKPPKLYEQFIANILTEQGIEVGKDTERANTVSDDAAFADKPDGKRSRHDDDAVAAAAAADKKKKKKRINKK